MKATSTPSAPQISAARSTAPAEIRSAARAGGWRWPCGRSRTRCRRWKRAPRRPHSRGCPRAGSGRPRTAAAASSPVSIWGIINESAPPSRMRLSQIGSFQGARTMQGVPAVSAARRAATASVSSPLPCSWSITRKSNPACDLGVDGRATADPGAEHALAGAETGLQPVGTEHREVNLLNGTRRAGPSPSPRTPSRPARSERGSRPCRRRSRSRDGSGSRTPCSTSPRAAARRVSMAWARRRRPSSSGRSK